MADTHLHNTATREPPALRLHGDDNVVVALTDLAAGVGIDPPRAVTRGAIPCGHKVAVVDIAAGELVVKYGQPIGRATRAIASGEHVHNHNLAMILPSRDRAVASGSRKTDFVDPARVASFNGFIRSDGGIATRNYVGVLTSVNCSATVARRIADAFRAPGALRRYPHVDGVVALTHGTGCGMSARGDGMEILRRTIAGYARHPNFAGVLLIGLGCEVNQIPAILEAGDLRRGERLQTMEIQDTGGTTAAIDAGVDYVKAMLAGAEKARRQPVPASALKLGLQCGGSDAYSGITANPALGAASDILVRHGGTVVLSETPEIYGAEHLLAARAETGAVGEKLHDLIDWWEEYTRRNGAALDSNPSPGNREGGITTILEKSLGAVAKAGATNLVDVIGYAEAVEAAGLVFMDSPGYDPVSVTGQVAGGCNIVAFTTGRGSCFGCVPAPSVKIATTADLYRRMTDDMDMHCGDILDGTRTVSDMGEEIFTRLLNYASGVKTSSEEMGYGLDEFTPWQIGAVV